MRYVLLKPAMLSFLTSQFGQFDATFDPGTVLECDGSTIWLLRDDERHESITTASFIPIMLKNGTLKEQEDTDVPI